MPERNSESTTDEPVLKTPKNRYNLDLSDENVKRINDRIIEASLKGDIENMRHLSSFLKEIEALKRKLRIK